MLFRFKSITAAFVLLSLISGIVLAIPSTETVKQAKSNQLVAMLPASDAVITLDVQRFFDEGLPLLLSSNKPMLEKVMAEVSNLQTRTGVNLRDFEFIAAGLSFNAANAAAKASAVAQNPTKTHDIEPVVIARGRVDSVRIIEAAKASAGNRYKEESIGEKKMFIFSLPHNAPDISADSSDGSSPENGTDAAHGNRTFIEKLHGLGSREIAIAPLDVNTIAFGKPERVRNTIENRTAVGSDVTNLLNRKPFGIMNFAGKVPAGSLSKFLPLDQDELGKTLDSIQYAYGSMDVSQGETQMSLTAKTKQASQAAELHDTLIVLQTIGSAVLGGKTRPDHQLYARLLDRVKFTNSGDEVSIDLSIPQSDVDALLAFLTRK